MIGGLRARDPHGTSFWKHIREARHFLNNPSPDLLIELIMSPRQPRQALRQLWGLSSVYYPVTYDSKQKRDQDLDPKHKALLESTRQPIGILREQGALIQELTRVSGLLDSDRRRALITQTEIGRYRLAVALTSCCLQVWSSSWVNGLCMCKIKIATSEVGDTSPSSSMTAASATDEPFKYFVTSALQSNHCGRNQGKGHSDCYAHRKYLLLATVLSSIVLGRPVRSEECCPEPI